MWSSSRKAFALHRAWSRLPTGEPRYPEMNPAVFRPAARSRARWSMGRRTKACVPVMKTRPDFRVYLSSRLTCRTRSGAFMSRGILPAREPRPQGGADLGRSLERGKVAAFFYDYQACPGNPVRHLLVPFQGGNRVLSAAQDQCGTGNGREQGEAVSAAHDRLLLAYERATPNISGHLLDSVH